MEAKNEIRQDPIEGTAVVIVPLRSRRPGGGLIVSKPERHGLASCTLCPKRIDREEAIMTVPDGRGGWFIKVARNKFPIARRDYPLASGAHEVIVETPDGRRPFERFGQPELRRVVDVYVARITALRSERSLRYVTVFKNVGRLAGASVAHAHSQLLATAAAPPSVTKRHERVAEARKRSGRCPYCALLAREAKGPRLVAAGKTVLAFAPFASRFPYELWIMPKVHRFSLTELTPAEKRETAALLGRAAKFMAAKSLDWNMVTDELFGAEEMHVSLRILPRGTIWAGVELASGIVTNPVAPEAAAAEYRRYFARGL
jgi:UDPglucose--hexose-1-phosphate uridylyltransferase